MNALQNTNGKPAPASPEQVEQEHTLEGLQRQLTEGYRPAIPVESMYNQMGMPFMGLRIDTEVMLTHPDVSQALNYFRGGIAGAEFWGGPNPDAPDDSPAADQGLPICPQDDKVGRFVKEQCERFWDRGVPLLQQADEYGWIGAEQIYDRSDGTLKWHGCVTFRPLDTYLLTQDFKPVGVRVKNVEGSSVPIDLWMAGVNVPAKGMWYPHCPRYNSHYGRSQLYSAWRPWRRLAYKDGLETVIDGALYRLGYQGPLARAPDEDLQGPNPGAANTTLDSQGRPRRFARDIMRQIVEQYKAGGSVVLPSKRDSTGNYLYDLILPTSALAGIDGLLNAAKALKNQITSGIGVPPELLEAAESGSGYSGRRIPLEAFLSNQQHIADALLQLFIRQVLTPLVRYNFGDGIRFNVQVKSLIKTRTKAAQAAAPSGAGSQSNQQPGQPPQGQQQRPAQPGQQAQDNPKQAMFSLVTDRTREIARRIVRAA
jgi:hypothetical protein